MKKISFWYIRDDIQKIREEKWNQEAIKLANKYLIENPKEMQAYLQLMDMYYVMWELEKSEKPLDFLLNNIENIDVPGIDIWLLYYIKAMLLSERTQWIEAKKYIKLALSYNNDNIEYNRLLSNIEFWSGNREKWYLLLKSIIDKYIQDADILLDAVNMSLSLWFKTESKKYVKLYFENKDKITYHSKSKSFYDRKMEDFKNILFDNI